MSNTDDPKHAITEMYTQEPNGIIIGVEPMNGNDTYVEVEDLGLTLELMDLQNKTIDAIKAGDLDQVMVFCKTTLDISPKENRYRLVANNNLGSCHYNKGEYEQAKQYLLATLEIAPTYTFALAMLAKVYLAMGATELASMIMKKAVASCIPDNRYWFGSEEAFSVMIDTCVMFREHQGLLQLLLQQKVDDLNDDVLYTGAVAAFNVGRYDLAKNWFQRVSAHEDSHSIVVLLMQVSQLMATHDLPAFPIEYCLGETALPRPDAPDILTDGMKCVVINTLWHAEQVRQERLLLRLTKSTDPWIEPLLRAVMVQPDLSHLTKQAAHEAA